MNSTKWLTQTSFLAQKVMKINNLNKIWAEKKQKVKIHQLYQNLKICAQKYAKNMKIIKPNTIFRS